MQKQIVSGYTITERLTVGDTVIALGENENAPSPYVTWQGHVRSDGFTWDHYFSHREHAVEDLYLRAATAAPRPYTAGNRKETFQAECRRERIA
jgi:hypothetical protein